MFYSFLGKHAIGDDRGLQNYSNFIWQKKMHFVPDCPGAPLSTSLSWLEYRFQGCSSHFFSGVFLPVTLLQYALKTSFHIALSRNNTGGRMTSLYLQDISSAPKTSLYYHFIFPVSSSLCKSQHWTKFH